MTAKEEDILTDRALLKKGIAIDRVLENLIVNKAIKLDDLLVGDKNAILVKARTTGYGSSYDTRVICPNCLTPCEHSFDLEELGHIDFEQSLEDDEVELTESNTFRVTLPMSKVTIECRMLTGGDESSIAKKALRNDRKNEASTTLTTQLGMLIVSINDNTDKFTKAKFIAAMPARDSRYLRGILEKVTPNIDMTQDFECEHCGEQAVLEVPLNTDFFWPK